MNLPKVVPTPGTDQLIASEPTLEQALEWARDIETRYVRLKLIHDALLLDQYRPLLVEKDSINKPELCQMIYEAGWKVQLDETFGSPEELEMWLNRFRRFRAAVIAGVKQKGK